MPDHIKRMHGNEEFSCDECTFTTKTKRRLTVHVGIKHSEKKFKCMRCESKFGFQFGLTHHMKTVHAYTFPENENDIVSCPFCNFKSKSWNVKRHLKVHKEKKNLDQPRRSVEEDKKYKYKCKFCEKSYAKQESLDNHLFTNHKNEMNIEDFKNRKFWACPDCDFKTIRLNPSYLKSHAMHQHKKQLGKVIFQDIVKKEVEIGDMKEIKKETEHCNEEYFEPKEENNSETERENLEQNGEISDEDSNDDGMMNTYEQNHSFLCPIKSCTFVMSCYDETTKNTHIETHHGEINLADVCFIKL